MRLLKDQIKLGQVLATDLKDINITPTDAQKQEFKSSIQAKYIHAIVTGLQNPFPDVENLDAFSIFDPQKLTVSESDNDDLAAYGQERLEYLTSAYPDVDSVECTSEWEGLKKALCQQLLTCPCDK